MNSYKKTWLIMMSVMVVAASGCNKTDVYEPETGVTLSDYFDFSTTKSVQLDVTYKAGGKVLFEVYGENPMKVVDGRLEKNKNLIALAKGITDEGGNYNFKAVLPASVNEVYIYSPSFGVPTLFKTTVQGNKVQANVDFESAVDLVGLVKIDSRAASGNNIMKNIPNRLSTWNKSGKPDLLNKEKLNIDRTMRSYINSYLPEGGGNGVFRAYISDNSDITLYEEASKVTINYLGGATTAQSVFAYYCYPENASVAEIKQAAAKACVIFPNAHAVALGDYSGVGIDLKYINPAGELVEGNFPKGTKIGFLLWNNGWLNEPYSSGNLFYSTKSLNADGVSHTAVLGIKDDNHKEYNVISFEDWTNLDDYNDVIFMISSDPAESIIVPPAPEPEPETYTETYQGIIGFEDCWPLQGDYDMNDVVVKYYSNITCNDKNQILSITDKFTLVWSGADLHNGFGFQFPFDMAGKKVEFTNGGTIHGNVVNLFNDAKKELKVEDVLGKDMPSATPQEVSYVITTTFEVPLTKEGIVPPYNSFITIGGNKNEVHLTNQRPTSEATNVFPSGADLSDGVNTWFICKDGFPFAIHMDARKDPSLLNLNLKPENVRIDHTYPGFAQWAVTRDPQKKWW